MLEVDKVYCMSSFLMYRTVFDKSKVFSKRFKPNIFFRNYDCEFINDSKELSCFLKKQIEEATCDGKAALALSGGIDSAILAKYMPVGSKAYTFKCVVPGVDVIDESVQAAKYAKECGLDHEVIEITWEDMMQYAPILMRNKGLPIHSIEVQILKAAIKAKKDGYSKLIFGESADVNYGGHSELLSREYTLDEFVERYSYVIPDSVLIDSDIDIRPYEKYLQKNGCVNVHEFVRNYYFEESMGSYQNACEVAGVDFVAPYSKTWLNVPLDYKRVRNGENKYLIREIFKELYLGWSLPTKIPMPRPTNEWLADWNGPSRDEFKKDCAKDLTGDQKWLLWSLEKFLDIIEE